MDTIFLPREVGSIETGPQIFAGTATPNTTIHFNLISEEPGLLNSVQVSNGGWSGLNGTFTYTTLFDGKPYYNKDGNGDLFIVWFNNVWGIYDFSINSIDPIYFSSQNTSYPWNINIWSVLNPIYNPPPIVTKVL
jgi:hypothetical protein